MAICSPNASDITGGHSPRVISLVEGEQIAMLPPHKDNNCFVMLTV